MNKFKLLLKIVSIAFVLLSCDSLEKDMEKPVVKEIIFPHNCDTVYKGSTFTYHFIVYDNYDLGSYSIEMHPNFDHHTHSTSAIQCEMDSIKSAVNPFLYIEEFEIPVKLWEYEIFGEIPIPSNADTGDYHFMLRVSDEAGWQNFEGISVKVM